MPVPLIAPEDLITNHQSSSSSHRSTLQCDEFLHDVVAQSKMIPTNRNHSPVELQINDTSDLPRRTSKRLARHDVNLNTDVTDGDVFDQFKHHVTPPIIPLIQNESHDNVIRQSPTLQSINESNSDSLETMIADLNKRIMMNPDIWCEKVRQLLNKYDQTDHLELLPYLDRILESTRRLGSSPPDVENLIAYLDWRKGGENWYQAETSWSKACNIFNSSLPKEAKKEQQEILTYVKAARKLGYYYTERVRQTDYLDCADRFSDLMIQEVAVGAYLTKASSTCLTKPSPSVNETLNGKLWLKDAKAHLDHAEHKAHNNSRFKTFSTPYLKSLIQKLRVEQETLIKNCTWWSDNAVEGNEPIYEEQKANPPTCTISSDEENKSQEVPIITNPNFSISNISISPNGSSILNTYQSNKKRTRSNKKRTREEVYSEQDQPLKKSITITEEILCEQDPCAATTNKRVEEINQGLQSILDIVNSISHKADKDNNEIICLQNTIKEKEVEIERLNVRFAQYEEFLNRVRDFGRFTNEMDNKLKQ